MTIGIRAGAVCLAASLAAAPAGLAQFAPQSATAAIARTATAPHVAIELLADPVPDASGRLWLGVKFDLDEHWHIYWQNPGDSGGPPAAIWQVPTGWQAGDFEWPAPERIEASGLVNYGYHGSVVLPAPVSPATGAAAAGTVRVSLRWLVCYDMCLPGKATIELALPLADVDRDRADGWRAAIADARARVPKPAPLEWNVRASSSPSTFELTIVTGRRETQGFFFPLDVSQINDSAPQAVAPLDNGLRLTLRKSDQLTRDPAHLRGVVSMPDGRAFVVSAPVSPGV